MGVTPTTLPAMRGIARSTSSSTIANVKSFWRSTKRCSGLPTRPTEFVRVARAKSSSDASRSFRLPDCASNARRRTRRKASVRKPSKTNEAIANWMSRTSRKTASKFPAFCKARQCNRCRPAPGQSACPKGRADCSRRFPDCA